MHRIFLALLIVLSVLPGETRAQGAEIGVFQGPPPYWHCGVVDNGPGVVKMYVLVNSANMSGVGFAAPLPACLTGGVYLSDYLVYSLTMGNSQTGIWIAFGNCIDGWRHVLTINVYMEGSLEDCCPYRFLRHPEGTGEGPEVIDCQDRVLIADDNGSFVTPGGFCPPFVEKPQPPDGATGQPIDTKLSWSVFYCSCALGVYWENLYFGTTPDPPLVAQELWHAYDPGPLEPQTTYYWKVRAFDSDAGDAGGWRTGPIWTFITGSALPVERSTWGRIKGLYLE